MSMIWRDQLRDLAVLYSLAEDLKLFWQLKNTRWEKLQLRVRQVAEQTANSSVIDEDEVAARFKKLVLADPDFKEVRRRIREAVKEVQELALFLGIAPPIGLDHLTFKPPLMDNDTIEAVIENVEEFIPLCRVSSYPYHHLWKALRSPREFTRSWWEHYNQ